MAVICHVPFDEVNSWELTEEKGRKCPQKGDFNGEMSFAIASDV